MFFERKRLRNVTVTAVALHQKQQISTMTAQISIVYLTTPHFSVIGAIIMKAFISIVMSAIIKTQYQNLKLLQSVCYLAGSFISLGKILFIWHYTVAVIFVSSGL